MNRLSCTLVSSEHPSHVSLSSRYPAWPLQDTRTPSTDTECTCGCNWTQSLPQALIGGLSDKGVTYVVTDAFHDVRDTGTLCSLCSVATSLSSSH